MCVTSSRAPAQPAPPPPPPPPAPVLEQEAPAYSTHETYEGPGHPRRQRGNKDYRYTPDSGGHVGATAPSSTTRNPHRS